MRYLCRRLLHAVLVLAGVSSLTFAFSELAPGDFLDELRLDPSVSAATVTALRHQYGLDKSLPQKYLQWLRSVAQGEFGFSVSHGGPVGPLLWRRAGNTLLLTVPATALAWLVAILVGAWTAARKGQAGDRAAAAATAGLSSVPDLVLGLAFLLLAVRTGWFPTGGMVSPGFSELDAWGQFTDVASHFFLPVLALTLVTAPVLIRHVRASLIEVLDTAFIHAARAQGIPERRLLFRNALRAAANPLISLLGLSIAGLLSTSLVIETILSWPGLGPLLLEAVIARDLHLVVGAVTCSTLLLVAGSLLADGLLLLVDPRIRTERT